MVKARPDESVDSMLKRFKRDVARSGILQDLRKHEFYIPPNEKRRIKQKAAEKRARKKAAKQKQY